MALEWYEILSMAIGVAGVLFGLAFWTKFHQAIKLLEELGEMLDKTAEVFGIAAEALKDRKVTKAEAVLLLKAWQEAYTEFCDVYAALRALLPASAIRFLFRR